MSRFARPYAQAFLETVPEGYDVEGFLSAAGAIVRAMAEDARLRHFLAGPSVPADAKRRVLDDLSTRAGVDDVGRRLLGLVLANRRISARSGIGRSASSRRGSRSRLRSRKRRKGGSRKRSRDRPAAACG